MISLYKLALKEFAPGIPADRKIKPFPKVKRPQKWTLAIQEHEARRAGKHYDVRLVDPQGRAHSWAVPKARLPDRGEKLLAIQQPTHTRDYALNFEGEIEEGYGAGKVKLKQVVPVEVVKAEPNRLKFYLYENKQPREYQLFRGKGNNWYLTQTTPTLKDLKIQLGRGKYQETAPEKIDFNDPNQMLQAKIDGAGVIVALHKKKPIRVVSQRSPKHSDVIEHTHKNPKWLQYSTPPELDNTVLRAELYGVDPKTHKAIPARQLAGILNSRVWKAREAKFKPRLAVFDIERYRGKNVQKLPYRDRFELIRKIVKKLPDTHIPPFATEPKHKLSLLDLIRKGKLKETTEGAVLWPLNDPNARPIKAPFRPLFDVYIRKIERGQGKYQNAAGAVYYSWTPHGRIVGRIGTGFTDAERKDMLQNPEKYIGRVAKVTAKGKHPSGALREPAFQEWHLEK